MTTNSPTPSPKDTNSQVTIHSEKDANDLSAQHCGYCSDHDACDGVANHIPATRKMVQSSEVQSILKELDEGDYSWVLYLKEDGEPKKVAVMPKLLPYIRELEAENKQLTASANYKMVVDQQKIIDGMKKTAKEWHDEGYAKGVSDGYNSTKRIAELELEAKLGNIPYAEAVKIQSRNKVLEAQNKSMKDWIIKNCTEKACKKDRDVDCFSCQAFDFLDSLSSK